MQRTQFFSGVELLIERDGKLLFLKRSPTNGFAPGWYCLPSGHADGAEAMETVAVREMREEIGVGCDPKRDLEFLHVAHRYRDDREYIIFFFKVLRLDGEPFNAEPDKHSEMVWLDPKNLPEPMIDREIISDILKGKIGFYSSWGFGI